MTVSIEQSSSLSHRVTPMKSINDITLQLEQGLKALFESEHYKDYLKTMSKFHNYSFNNTILIAMQMPDATFIAGYKAWQKKFDRHVKKGEKGIRILAPSSYKKNMEQDVIKTSNPLPQTINDGNTLKESAEVTVRFFHPISVFDISQTEGPALNLLMCPELNGCVSNYDTFLTAITTTSLVPITFEDIGSGSKGYFSPTNQKIVIQSNMSETQTVKTLIHELAHSLIHDKNNRIDIPVISTKSTRSTKEVEAESIAYTVCQYFNIDTSEYSFEYIAGWSSSKDTKELRSSMETIRTTADYIITSILSNLGITEFT